MLRRSHQPKTRRRRSSSARVAGGDSSDSDRQLSLVGMTCPCKLLASSTGCATSVREGWRRRMELRILSINHGQPSSPSHKLVRGAFGCAVLSVGSAFQKFGFCREPGNLVCFSPADRPSLRSRDCQAGADRMRWCSHFRPSLILLLCFLSFAPSLQDPAIAEAQVPTCWIEVRYRGENRIQISPASPLSMLVFPPCLLSLFLLGSLARQRNHPHCLPLFLASPLHQADTAGSHRHDAKWPKMNTRVTPRPGPKTGPTTGVSLVARPLLWHFR